VTSHKKILIACAIVAAGYTFAAVLGRPKISGAPIFRESGNPQAADQTAAAQPDSNFIDVAASIAPPGGLRLVPDRQASSSGIARDAENVPAPIALSASEPAAAPPPVVDAAANVRAPTPVDSSSMSSDRAAPRPRATLRNAAPRPILSEPRPPAPATNLQPGHTENSAPATNANAPASFEQRSSGVTAADYSLAPATSSPKDAAMLTGATIRADNHVPLPFPSITDDEEGRSHIIVDGDSLSKLAGLYLDDPRRAAEIYELNRQLISDPELLPIGVELAIPPRTGSAATGDVPPQSMLPRTVAIHSAAAGGLVPVRPIPSAPGTVPRAFLAPPRPAE
jgi:nucleoid-associated protein YgaU